MALIQWSDDLSVKVGTFDNHHMKLINLINELHDAMQTGKAKTVIEKTLKSLLDYTKYHFGEEEKLMTSHNYPGFAEHKKQHENFVNKVTDFIDKHQRGAVTLTIELMNFLTGWLKEHIKGTDKQYSGFFNVRKVA